MCDRLILYGSAYICNRCFEELEAYFEKALREDMTSADVETVIREFMETSPGSQNTPGVEDLRETFRSLTGT